jgi:hypothetical protein
MGAEQMNFAILELAGGYISLVDLDDFEKVSKYNWCTIKQGNSQVRAMTKIDDKSVYLHQFIMGGSEQIIDHINGHALDNRKSNLRIGTIQQNCFNSRMPRTNTSGFKGVSFDKGHKKFRAYIVKDRRQYHLGFFSLKEDAAKAYNEKALELFGEFARLNKC